MTDELERLAAACAARLLDSTGGAASLEDDFGRLIDQLKTLDPTLAFDREGRPGAIAAVREALPLQERELLDAILEDHECELAAVRAAMFQIVRAARG